MQSRITRKIVEWWVYRDVSTGRWGYTNRHPGDKQAGIEGPMNFDKARDRVYVKNKEVEK